MSKRDDLIAGLGFDKSYESDEEFTKDLLKRFPNAAVADPELRDSVSESNDISED